MPQEQQPPTSWNRQELAARYGVSVRTIDERTRARLIPHLRFGSRVVYVPLVILEWERAQAMANLTEPVVDRSPAEPPRRGRRRGRVAQPVGAQPAASRARRPGFARRSAVRRELAVPVGSCELGGPD